MLISSFETEDFELVSLMTMPMQVPVLILVTSFSARIVPWNSERFRPNAENLGYHFGVDFQRFRLELLLSYWLGLSVAVVIL